MTDPAYSSMRVVPGVDALTHADGPLYVVVGVFDGLHLGHQYLLRHLRTGAARHEARPAVITFDHHPDEILIGAAPPLLCDPEERLQRLSAAGVGVTVVQHFDEALRMTAYDEFVERIESRTELAGFLMTPDAAFGHDRLGTPGALAELGAERGFEVDVVAPFVLDGQAVRSSDIRTAITDGDLARAARLLGRAVAVVGDATADGDGTMSFPLPVALPPEGQYAVSVARQGGRPRAAQALIEAGRLRLDPSTTGHLRVSFA